MSMNLNLTPVSEEVKKEVKSYFEEQLPNYEVVKVIRKSNHPDDHYLYEVAAKKKNADEYACWTSYNSSITGGSLNYGHYNLVSLEVCDEIMSEYFHDITKQ